MFRLNILALTEQFPPMGIIVRGELVPDNGEKPIECTAAIRILEEAPVIVHLYSPSLPAGKGDDFISKISSINVPDPSIVGLAFNPITMEYEQTCGCGPNGEPEFDTDYYDD